MLAFDLRANYVVDPLGSTLTGDMLDEEVFKE